VALHHWVDFSGTGEMAPLGHLHGKEPRAFGLQGVLINLRYHLVHDRYDGPPPKVRDKSGKTKASTR
jgi:hypothetical protein